MSLIPVPDLTRKNKILLAVVLIVSILIPALFWQSVWFGRPLTPEQIEQQLTTPSSAREVQHALALVEQLIRSGDDQASRYYPAISRLSTNEREEIRTLASWVMGQGTTSRLFRETLLQMLEDPHPLVRRNAALGAGSLFRPERPYRTAVHARAFSNSGSCGGGSLVRSAAGRLDFTQ